MTSTMPDPEHDATMTQLGLRAQVSRRSAVWRELRQRPGLLIATTFVAVLIVIAITAPWLTPYDPDHQELADRLAGPSWSHPLGTDNVGRDVLSRIMVASRLALLASLIAVGVAVVLSVPPALLAGYRRGWIDAVTGRIADTLLSLPGLAFALAIVAVLGPGLVNAMLALGVVFSPRLYRVVRASTLSVAEEPYIESARSVGCSAPHIVIRHVFPNIVAPFFVQVTILMGVALIAEASLSFLGLGVQPPDSSWGSMLRAAYENQYESRFAVLPAGTALVLTVLAFNTIGDGIRDMVARAS